jgi:hypothetical protein
MLQSALQCLSVPKGVLTERSTVQCTLLIVFRPVPSHANTHLPTNTCLLGHQRAVYGLTEHFRGAPIRDLHLRPTILIRDARIPGRQDI